MRVDSSSHLLRLVQVAERSASDDLSLTVSCRAYSHVRSLLVQVGVVPHVYSVRVYYLP